MKPVNVAVVGLGYWGPNLARNIASCSLTELSYLCDSDATRVKKIGSIYPSVKKTTDILDVIRDKSIEAVAIATPVDTHFQLAKQCLSAGKHVLLEKPMTRTVKQAKKLIELANKMNVMLMVDHTFNYTSAIRKIRDIVTSGELGEILYWDSVRINLGLFQNDVNVVWDLAPHDLAMLDHVFAHKPKSIQAFGIAHYSDNIENIAYMILRFSNKMIAHFTFNWLSPIKVRTTIIGGSRKMLVFNDMESSEKIKIYNKGVDLAPTKDNVYKRLVQYRIGDMYAPQIENVEALNTEINHFARVVRNREKPISGAEDGLRVVNLLEAAERSIKRKGKEILL